jgi:hypothetical protein
MTNMRNKLVHILFFLVVAFFIDSSFVYARTINLGLYVLGKGTGVVTHKPGGGTCSSSTPGWWGVSCYSFEEGTIVTITADPTNGSNFDRWYGPCIEGQDKGQCQILISQSLEVPTSVGSFIFVGTVFGNPTPLSEKSISGGRLNLYKVLTSNAVITPMSGFQTVNRGESTHYPITVQSLNNYSGPVTLNFSADVQGITGMFDTQSVTLPPNGTVNAVLTVTTTADTQRGIYPLVISGQDSQGNKLLAPITLHVLAPALHLSVKNVSHAEIEPGMSASFEVTASSFDKLSGSFTLNMSVSDQTISGKFEPVQIVLSPDGVVKSILTVQTASTTQLQAHNLTEVPPFFE